MDLAVVMEYWSADAQTAKGIYEKQMSKQSQRPLISKQETLLF